MYVFYTYSGLVMNPIFQYELFLTFQKCKALYPGNTCVQKCFGEIMDVCFSKLYMYRTQRFELL